LSEGTETQLKSGEQPFTLVLDDPLANSHIQSLYAPDPDPSLTMELYERTWQQNEELGLNDLKVDNY
jgi:zinc finger protein